MKKVLMVLSTAVFMPLFLLSQTGEGLAFSKEENWKQVLNKAKAENKYIFVDCFATWCNPCKKMDQKIYTQQKVGEFYNENFLSVKIQIDSSKNDDKHTINWYNDASIIKTVYKINSVPSYLFFSPQGELVNRDQGYKEADDFINVGKKSLDTASQFYTCLAAWRAGRKEYSALLDLYKMARKMKDTVLGDSLARDYQFYLNQVDADVLLTKENLEFSESILQRLTSKDRIFQLAYAQPLRLDSMMRKGWSENLVHKTIGKEEINNYLWVADKCVTQEPDWKAFRNTIQKKYPAVDVNKIILMNAFNFYRKMENWHQYTKYRTDYNKYYINNSTDLFWGINVPAWDIFLHCSNRKALEQALAWSEYSIQFELPKSYFLMQYLDTRANLLYKLGRVKEAIEQEEKAVALSIELGMPTAAGPIKTANYDGYLVNLDKMKRNIPTW
jgi:thioredoxin-related protein